jgi:ABC-type polysaccharide/polyol phosphate export permease
MKVSCFQLLSLTMKMFIEFCVVVPYDFIFFIYLFTILFMFCLIYSLVLAILNVGHRKGYIGIFTTL